MPEVRLSVENAPPKAAPQVPPDRVVIAAGDVKITAAQFNQIVASLPQQYQNPARRKEVADSLARVFVLAQEGQHRKLNESSEYKIRTMFTDANTLAGMTAESMQKDLKLDDAEVRKYYDDHKKELEQVHARHILIRMQGSPVPVKPGQKELSDAEALAKAQELRKKLEGGADFAALATQESDDAGSGAKGGDLGFVHRGQMVPSFEEAAFTMKPGELSQPVKSQFGYHIIKVEAVKSFEELRPDIESRVKPAQLQKAIEELQKKTPAVLDPEFFGMAKQ